MRPAKTATMEALWAAATRHADVEQGIACAGTAVECRTAKVRGRAFLFLRSQDARFKLSASAPEAARPGAGCRVGKGGWCHVLLGAADAPALDVMERWIAESYALMSGPAQRQANPRTRASRGRPAG